MNRKEVTEIDFSYAQAIAPSFTESLENETFT
jgi:hypothetical protein